MTSIFAFLSWLFIALGIVPNQTPATNNNNHNMVLTQSRNPEMINKNPRTIVVLEDTAFQPE